MALALCIMRENPVRGAGVRCSPGSIYVNLLAHLEGESSNTLFEVLDEWERHLAQLDPKGLRCDHDKPAP